MGNGFWSVKELAENFNISLSKGYQLVYSQGFPALRLGRRIIVPVDKLEAWINKNLGIKK